MTINPALFSSATDDHPTPQDLFDKLNREFGFVLDVAASAENAKCPAYLTKEQDALTWDWAALAREAGGGAIYMNCPYGDGERVCKAKCKKKRCAKRGFHCLVEVPGVGDWVEKAALTSTFGGVTVVCLLPARTDTRWFQRFVWSYEGNKPQPYVEVRFIKGRLKFGGAKNSAPFPSMVVVFRPVTP